MQCDISVLKEMKEVLLEGVKENSESQSVNYADGTSAKYAEEFYKEQLRNIRNPEEVIQAMENRAKQLENPLHATLVRNFGESITLVEDGKESDVYLVSSSLHKSPDVPGGVEVVVGTVKVLGETPRLHRFTLNNDTAMGSGVVIEGIADVLRKTLVTTIQAGKSAGVGKVVINSKEYPAAKATLNKLADSNEVLGAKVESITPESLEGYEEITDYEHGDIDSMRKILHRLHVLGGSKATQAELAHYDSLLSSMHPRFFNKLKLFYKKTLGAADGRTVLEKNMVLLDVAPAEVKGMSEAEIYTHEIVHTMVGWALRQSAVSVSKIRSQLAYAMDVAGKEMSWEDFLDVPVENATESQKALAERTYTYVFGGGNSVDEFVAYSLTNPKFMEKVKNIKLTRTVDKDMTIFEKVSTLFFRIVDVVLGRYEFKSVDLSVFEQVNSLAFQLGEINDKYRRTVSKSNPIGKMIQVLNNGDTVVSEHIKKVMEKIGNKDRMLQVPKEDASVARKAKFLLEATVKAATNPLYRGFFGLGLSAHGLKPESSIREIASSFFDKEGTVQLAERLKMSSEHIDSVRNSQSNAISTSLVESFSRKLTDEEDGALTRVLLDTGLASMWYEKKGKNKFTSRDIARILENEGARTKEVDKLKNRIKELLKGDNARANWTINQAQGLGFYLATHKSNVVQNFNANNIALGYGRPEKYTRVEGLAEMVEELAVMTSIMHIEPINRMTVAELIRKEPKGVSKITDTYQSYKKYSEEALFNEGNEAHIMMGHTKELLDSSIDVTVAPITKKEELEKQGYEYRYTLPAKNGDKYDVPMAMFTTPQWGKVERLKGAVGLGTTHTKGTTISSLKYVENSALAKDLFGRDFANIQRNALRLHQEMEKDDFNWDGVVYGMAPVVNSAGKVTDYRYMMEKKEKEDLFLQDTRATQVLARSISSITDLVATKQLNDKVLSAITLDMQDNWKEGSIGEDGYTEYYLIGPTTTDEGMRALYYMLPESFKDYIDSREDKTIAVRKDLLYTYFGYKHMRLSDMVGLNLLPAGVKNIINIMETLWMEMIKLSKMAILMKMPLVLVDNLISNLKYMITTGSLDVVELLKDYSDSFREVSDYIRNNRELLALSAEVSALRESLNRVDTKKIREDLFKKEAKVARLLEIQNANPAKKLFDAGMYQSYVEDISTASVNETNLITKAINKQLDKAPKIVRSISDIVFITQNTLWYKMSQEVMQRTDMVSRLAENKRMLRMEAAQVDGKQDLPAWWLAKRKDKTKRKVLTGNEKREFLEQAEMLRMGQLRDNYVNYTKPNGRGEEYLNRIGVLMFTKYLKRIQHVVFNSVINNPVKSALSLGLSISSTDYEAFQEQSWLSRMMGQNGDISVTNIVPTYGLMYHFENVLTPPIVKEELYFNML